MSLLTARQRQILVLVAAGRSNQQIANELRISTNTVAEVLTAAYRRLGASDRAHAVTLAIYRGEISHYDLARIADAATRQGSTAPPEGADARLTAPQPASDLPEGRGVDRPPQSRTDAAA